MSLNLFLSWSSRSCWILGLNFFNFLWRRYPLPWLRLIFIFRLRNRSFFLFLRRISPKASTWRTINFNIFCSWVHVTLPSHIVGIFLSTPLRSLLLYRRSWSGRWSNSGMLWSLRFLFRGFFAGRWMADLIFTSLAIYFHIFCCWVHVALPCHIMSIFFNASWRSLSVVTDYWSWSRLWCWCRPSWDSLLLSNKLSFRSRRLFLRRFLWRWLFFRGLSSSLPSTGLSISFDILGSWV